MKTWHVLRYLASRGHQVTLASFVRPEEEKYILNMRTLVSDVRSVPIHRSRIADLRYWLRSQRSGRPFLVERDDLPAMRAIVERLVRLLQPDFIHADQLTMAQFALPYARRGPRLVFDAHNAVWTIVERMRENASPLLKPLAAQEARRVKAYEGEIVRTFDHTLAVTEPDRQALLQATRLAERSIVLQEDGQPAAERIMIAPIAVDTQALQPARRKHDSFNILTLGTLHYPPNADGVRWFAREVFPLIRRVLPDATLTIVGKNPPADFEQLARQHPGMVRVTGYVLDLDPYMDAASVLVVPVRAGGGMRVRILEAFARQMPVVTTTVGLEGIEARSGEHLLVADDPAAFARSTLRLMQDGDYAGQLAANGRRLAEERYDWQVVLQKMDLIYGEAHAGKIEAEQRVASASL